MFCILEVMEVKKLIIINGVPGIGKSSTCKELTNQLVNSVWLDGDWCWMMNPFIVNEENKRMVEDNITYLLRSFLKNSSFEYVVFNWVIPKEFIFELILDRLLGLEYKLYKYSLVCNEETLKSRMKQDLRTEERIHASIRDLNLYNEMNTVKIDTTSISAKEAAELIRDFVT
jgi:broad-specificity NMP kinase